MCFGNNKVTQFDSWEKRKKKKLKPKANGTFVG